MSPNPDDDLRLDLASIHSDSGYIVVTSPGARLLVASHFAVVPLLRRKHPAGRGPDGINPQGNSWPSMPLLTAGLVFNHWRSTTFPMQVTWSAVPG